MESHPSIAPCVPAVPPRSVRCSSKARIRCAETETARRRCASPFRAPAAEEADRQRPARSRPTSSPCSRRTALSGRSHCPMAHAGRGAPTRWVERKTRLVTSSFAGSEVAVENEASLEGNQVEVAFRRTANEQQLTFVWRNRHGGRHQQLTLVARDGLSR